jgi:hypothetical protein
MQNDTIPAERVVRMDDFFAEQLEQEADIMPSGMADKAAILRKKAMTYRTSDNAKMLTIRYHRTGSEEYDAAPAGGG